MGLHGDPRSFRTEPETIYLPGTPLSKVLYRKLRTTGSIDFAFENPGTGGVRVRGYEDSGPLIIEELQQTEMLPDARLMYLAGPTAIALCAKRWKHETETVEQQLLFIQDLGAFSTPEVFPIMLDISGRAKAKAKKAALGWFASHAAHCRTFLEQAANGDGKPASWADFVPDDILFVIPVDSGHKMPACGTYCSGWHGGHVQPVSVASHSVNPICEHRHGTTSPLYSKQVTFPHALPFSNVA